MEKDMDSPSQLVKKNLALAYQILAHLGLDDLTYTHLSAREPGSDHFYIYPFGLLFEEVNENNLLKVALDGTVVEGQECQYNRTGYVIHSNIYKARSDINCIFHLHTHATVAVSALRQGLAPISQWALHFYEKVAYHEYDSLSLDFEIQGGRLARDLGDKKVALLRNHGMLTCGSTIHEALFYTHHLEQACKTQIMIQSTNQEICIPSHETCLKSVGDLLSFEKDLGIRDWTALVRKIQRVKLIV